VEFYKEGGEAIRAVLERIEAIRGELEAAYLRWDDLDSAGR
jgi:hypothetical protein